MVQIKLSNEQEIQGEFIGTYMNHIHILKDEKLYYYGCDKILFIASPKRDFSYDCSKNTLTADILFPPELDPMTGKWVQIIPEIFNPIVTQPVAIKDIGGFYKNQKETYSYEVESKIDNEVPTFGEIDSSEEDFIMVNGVKYIRSGFNEESEQDRINLVSREDVIYEAKQTAKQMERRSFNQFLGAGSCLFSYIGVPVSILYVEFIADSRMDPENPFYFELDPSLKVEYERYYKKEEKRLRRKRVYGTQKSCLIFLIGWISFNVAYD